MAKNSDKKSSCPSFSTKENENSSNEWGLTTWITYSSVFVLILSYCVFLYDRDIFKHKSHVPGISQLETLFDAIEKYSPFHEFLLDDYYELKEKIKAKSENDIKEYHVENIKDQEALNHKNICPWAIDRRKYKAVGNTNEIFFGFIQNQNFKALMKTLTEKRINAYAQNLQNYLYIKDIPTKNQNT